MQCYHLKNKFLSYFRPKPNPRGLGDRAVVALTLQGTYNDADAQELCSGWGCNSRHAEADHLPYLLHFHCISALSYSPKVARQEYSQALGSPSCNKITTLVAKIPLPTSIPLWAFLIRDGMCPNVITRGAQLDNAAYPVSAVRRQDFNSTLSLMKFLLAKGKTI